MVAAISSHLTLQDRIRVYLNEKIEKTGSNYIPVTISDLADELHESRMPVYQALYRIKGNNEIELDQDENPDNRNKIRGIKVLKLEPSNRTYRRAAERGKVAVAKQVNNLSVDDVVASMPNLLDYLNQRLTIEKMREAAKASNLDPDNVVQFEQNPLAEEGLLLLQKLTSLSKEHEELKVRFRQQEFDLEAANRDIEYLKNQKQFNGRSLVAVS
jgi:hypothetical protein